VSIRQNTSSASGSRRHPASVLGLIPSSWPHFPLQFIVISSGYFTTLGYSLVSLASSMCMSEKGNLWLCSQSFSPNYFVMPLHQIESQSCAVSHSCPLPPSHIIFSPYLPTPLLQQLDWGAIAFWMGSESTRSQLALTSGYFRGGHREYGMVWVGVQ
jgi:hypothetical protein